jgi:uncharacterized protein
MVVWTVFNTFFLIGSLPMFVARVATPTVPPDVWLSNFCHSNLVYIGIFATVELSFLFVAASYFTLADGNEVAGVALAKTGGVFAFLSGLLGWYTLGHLMCQEALFFSFPMGDTSHYFKRRDLDAERPAPLKEA